MNYGWATVFTLAAWFAGLVIDVNVRVGDLGLRTVLPVIVMGCCIMKFIKDNNPEPRERHEHCRRRGSEQR